MKSLAPNLRLLLREAAPLGQAVVHGSHVIVAHHVLNEHSPLGIGCPEVWEEGRGGPLKGSLSVVGQVPQADTTVCTLGGQPVGDALVFAWRVERDMAVNVHSLEACAGGYVRYRLRPSAVRDLVVVDSYRYRPAHGPEVMLKDTRMVFLDLPASGGMSGAVVSLAHSGEVVGFIHGNALENDGAAICLDPRPLIAYLKAAPAAAGVSRGG